MTAPTLALLFALAAVVLAVWAVYTFNRLVRLRNQVRNAWADIDVQLRLRHDLVPQLVEVTRGYTRHERALLERVTQLRGQAMQADGIGRQGLAEEQLHTALDRLLLLREDYPDLKASAQYLELQQNLVAVEERLQYARRFYNGAVRDHNDAVQRFPDLLLARPLGFGLQEFFQAGNAERQPVSVELTA